LVEVLGILFAFQATPWVFSTLKHVLYFVFDVLRIWNRKSNEDCFEEGPAEVQNSSHYDDGQDNFEVEYGDGRAGVNHGIEIQSAFTSVARHLPISRTHCVVAKHVALVLLPGA